MSRALVAVIEGGGLESSSVRTVRRISGALGISIWLDPRWRGADLAKLLDERHALMVREVVRRLEAAGWRTRAEATFSIRGERGSVDVLASHPGTRAMACIEVKTKLADLQDLLSTMDRKRRLAPALARELGWECGVVASILVLPAESWARHGVDRFAPLFDSALPERTRGILAWIHQPDRALNGIWFPTQRQRG